MAAVSIGQGPDRLQDNCDDVPALPAPVQMAAAEQLMWALSKKFTLSYRLSTCYDFKLNCSLCMQH